MSVGSKVTRVRGVFVGVSVGVDCDIPPMRETRRSAIPSRWRSNLNLYRPTHTILKFIFYLFPPTPKEPPNRSYKQIIYLDLLLNTTVGSYVLNLGSYILFE